MALTFNSREAFQKLTRRGLPEPAADAIVEVVEDATNTVVTADVLHNELQVVRNEVRAEFSQFRAEMRADMYRAFWLFGSGIVATLGVIVAVATALD